MSGHHESCTNEDMFLVGICGQCGLEYDAGDLLDALQVIFDAVEGQRVTIGDCNQARAAIARYHANSAQRNTNDKP